MHTARTKGGLARVGVSTDGERLYLGERLSISFQRTLRVPEDGQSYPLPPGLGPFPIRLASELGDRLPPSWAGAEAFFIPLYQGEALWIGFIGAAWKPNAVKIALGAVNALTGKSLEPEIRVGEEQDYIVCPEQPWLDGINAGAGYIKQFVATRLGSGDSVEAQITGREERGGLQFFAYEPRPGTFPTTAPPPGPEPIGRQVLQADLPPEARMGLGAGGRIKQRIYPDPYGASVWETDASVTVRVHIVNTEQYRALTGDEPPPSPIKMETYAEYGLPWFELYDETKGDIAPAEALEAVTSVGKRLGSDASAESPKSPDQAGVDPSTLPVHKLRYPGIRRPNE